MKHAGTSAVVVTAIAVLLSGYVAKAQGINTPDTALWETRVFVADSCPSSPPTAKISPLVITLATTLLPKVIDFGVSFANRAIQKKADEEKSKNNAVQAVGLGAIPGFYRHQVVDGRPALVSGIDRRCLIVVRGSFAGNKAKSKPCNNYPQALASACDWSRDNGVNELGIYLESQFVLSDDGASFRLQPKQLSYLRPISGKSGTPETGNYDLTFNVSFEAPAAPGGSIAGFGLGVLSFEQIRPEGEYDQAVLAGKSSGWTPAMAVTGFQQEIGRVAKMYSDKMTSEDNLAELKPKTDPGSKEIAALEGTINSLSDQILTWSKQDHTLGPTNIVVKMTEQPHLPQNMFLLTAAEVFANSTTDIGNAVSNTLNQAIIEATPQGQASKVAQQGAMVIAALNASKVVDEKQAALDKLPQEATDARKLAARDLEIAKIQANIAYVAAGRSPPHPDVFGG